MKFFLANGNCIRVQLIFSWTIVCANIQVQKMCKPQKYWDRMTNNETIRLFAILPTFLLLLLMITMKRWYVRMSGSFMRYSFPLNFLYSPSHSHTRVFIYYTNKYIYVHFSNVKNQRTGTQPTKWCFSIYELLLSLT